MKKTIVFFKFCFFLSFAYCERIQAQVVSQNNYVYLYEDSLVNNVNLNRILLKHHFFCACIESNSRTDIIKGDETLSNYYLLISGNYTLEGTDKLFLYEENFRKKINPSGIFSACIKHYESKELNEFVMSLDKYFIKR